MADAPDIPSELPLAPNGEVKAFDRLGNKITVPKDRVGELYGMGGRVARRAEVDAAKLDEEYAKKSTVEKAAGFATPALPLPAQMALRGAGVAPMSPEFEAYRAGASSTLTGGIESLATKEGVDLIAGKQAAHAFGEAQIALKEAHPEAYTGGQLAGLGASLAMGGPKAGLGKAGLATPGVAIGAAGGLAERGVTALAGAVAPNAAKTAIGRALLTGGEFGARGAVEGALLSGANQLTENELGDKESVTDKVWAAMGTGALYGGVGGVALGGAGSLAASGGRAALGGARSALGKALTRGAEAEAPAAAKALPEGGAAAERTAADAEAATKATTDMATAKQEPGLTFLGKRSTDVVDDLAFTALGTTRKIADKINTEVEGGTRAVGDYVNRRILKTAADDASLAGIALKGRSDEMLPLIQADKASIGTNIGDVVKANPVKVSEADLLAASGKIAQEMASDPTRIQGTKAFTDQVAISLQALRNRGALVGEPGAGAIDLGEMYYARAAMEGVAHEMGRSNSASGEAMKSWLREVDAHLVDKIDDAAKAVGNAGAKDELLGLKREYQLASWAEKAAEDGTKRLKGNNTFGLREGTGTAVGFAMGHPFGGLAAGVAGKIARERGAAMAAYAITKMSDMASMARAVNAVNDAIGGAAKGVLAAPAKGAGPVVEIPGARAQQAMARIAAIQADPAAYAERVSKSAESLQGVAPNIAAGIVQRQIQAAAFMASKVPNADRDPLDPHPMPKLSKQQEAELARYDYYCEKPIRFFEEASRGKMTYEGAEVAKALMPYAFAELQQRTLAGLADLMTRGQKPPIRQRRVVGLILDVPVTPDQRPEHMQLLQQNVISSPANGPKAPTRPLQLKTQHSTLDRLEGR